ncbi:MAG TPA: aminodeoxychorismate synthase component I [Candidatus Angelobacter sp.]|nr:aminodeoxychorismate synthase component I [Candidatus Angelobacter sp.]
MAGPSIGDCPTQYTRLPEYIYKIVAESPGSVLLETSRFDSSNQRSYLFLKPIRVIAVNHLNEIPAFFAQIEAALANGLYAAGYFSYECGYHFERFDGPLPTSDGPPLAWIGIYSNPIVFDHEPGRFTGSDPVTASAQNPEQLPGAVVDHVTLEIGKDEYCARILEIKERIASGETYQVNFTDRVSFDLSSSPAATFAALAKQQPVAYSAFLNVADQHILSFSPELFFRIDNGRIVTRPMKGTMARGLDSDEDMQAAVRLQNDEKNRSEHVMIVDLLRNDLGRICAIGSIQVDGLFSIEKYETLLQMTSTVSGVLRPQISYYDIFRSLFPSGSVTGAPKIHTMEIIRELERTPRGAYTGAIGFISPHGASIFNVAIRTLVLKDGRAQMGVGGGIVADSDPAEEYRECLLKASFLTRARRDFQLIETMLWEKDFFLLSMHLERLESSAAYFNFACDRNGILLRLHELSKSFTAGKSYRVRLLLSSNGSFTVEDSELHAEQYGGCVRLSNVRTFSSDVFLRHKTTQREIYDRQYAEARAAGLDEVIFQNERGEITEGAISNIFIRKSGKMITPPLSCGVLPGVFRRYLLETDANAEERIVTMEDLKAADAVFLCNSVRGLREVKSILTDVSPITFSKAHT